MRDIPIKKTTRWLALLFGLSCKSNPLTLRWKFLVAMRSSFCCGRNRVAEAPKLEYRTSASEATGNHNLSGYRVIDALFQCVELNYAWCRSTSESIRTVMVSSKSVAITAITGNHSGLPVRTQITTPQEIRPMIIIGSFHVMSREH